MALKVFKPRFRLPYLVSQAEKLAALANLPGLQAAHRNVLTRTQNPHLLQQYPDLIYAVLMPWIEGPTWLEVMLDKHPLTSPQALDLARALAQVLETLELRGIAHCDLSAPNVMLPHLAGGTGVALVDLEGVYAPDMTRPQELSSGSAGYAHKQATGGLWGPEADRFAGAVLLAEMLGWCDEQVVQAAWGESYFDPQEMQQETPRYRTLVTALERQWGNAVAYLFERAWKSDTLLDCPTFGEWLVALPEAVGSRQVAVGSGQSAVGSVQSAVGGGQVEASAEIRAFMQAARRMEDKNDLDSALKLYRQALELAQAAPSLRSLAREIELTIEDVRTRYEAAQRARRQAEEQARRAAEEKGWRELEERGKDAGEEPRRKRRWGWMIGGFAGLIVCCVLVTIVYGVNLQQQQAAQATAMAIAWQQQATATARAIPTPTPPVIGTGNAGRIQQIELIHSASWVESVAFSPLDPVIAWGGNGGIWLYDVARQQLLHHLIGHTAQVHRVSFSPDGRFVLSSGATPDRTTRSWDVRTGAPLEVFEAYPGGMGVNSTISPSGGTFVSISGGDMWITDIATGSRTRLESPGGCCFIHTAWSPDGSLLAIGGGDNNIAYLFRTSNWSLLYKLEHESLVGIVTFSPDGRILAAEDDTSVRLWQVDTGTLWKTLNQPADPWGLAFSPDGQLLAVGLADGTIRIWDVTTGREVNILRSHTGFVTSLAFSYDGRILASGSLDGTVRLWGVK